MITTRNASLTSVALALALAAAPAAAQTAEGQAPVKEQETAQTSSTDSLYQGDIIVTARRRPETEQQTPVAMTVLNDALLDRYAITGIDSIASLTPGFFTGETSGSAGGSISLRGVGSGEGQAFIDQAVSVNVDGVQISTAQILRAAQMDLQQIEVLRGPQALFFGKNSPGGIISVITADPGDELEIEAATGYEFEAEEWYLDGHVSVPVTENFGLRVAGHYGTMNGFIDVISPPAPGINPSSLDAFPDREELFLRGTALFEPSDRLSIRLKGTYTDTSVRGGPSYFSDIVFCPYGLPQEPIVIPSNCENDGVIVAAQIPEATLALNPLLKPDGHRDNEQVLLTGTVEFDLTDDLALTSVTGYYDVSEVTSSHGGYGLAATNVFAVQYGNEQISEELRLASTFDGPLNFLVGGFFEHRKLFTQTYIVIPTAGNFELPVESTNQEQDSYSAFGQLIWDASDTVQITAGGRYSHEIKKVLDYTVTTAPFGTPVLTGGTSTDVTTLPAYPDTRLTFDNFSPEVTATYIPNNDLMLFASFKTGYKSGGFDAGYTAGAILANPSRRQSFAPEKVLGGEVGMKSTWADRQITFNITGYWYDYEDLQVTTYDTAARAFTTQNAAKARVRGVEIESSYRPNAVPGLSLHAALAYNDAKFREYLADCYKGQSEALGCDQIFAPAANQTPPGPTQAVLLNGQYGYYTTQDLTGVQLRKAPEFTANVGAYYETPLTTGLMMSLSTDLSYSSSYNYGSTYQPFAEQNDFAKIDATFRLFSEDNRYELALIGRNLTDKLNLVNGIDRTGTGGLKGYAGATCATASQAGCQTLPDIIGTPARGRSMALQLTYRY